MHFACLARARFGVMDMLSPNRSLVMTPRRLKCTVTLSGGVGWMNADKLGYPGLHARQPIPFWQPMTRRRINFSDAPKVLEHIFVSKSSQQRLGPSISGYYR